MHTTHTAHPTVRHTPIISNQIVCAAKRCHYARRHADMLVFMALDTPDTMLGVVVSYAMHPTCVGPERMESADYPGAVCKHLEAEWKGATALYLNGCVHVTRVACCMPPLPPVVSVCVLLHVRVWCTSPRWAHTVCCLDDAEALGTHTVAR